MRSMGKAASAAAACAASLVLLMSVSRCGMSVGVWCCVHQPTDLADDLGPFVGIEMVEIQELEEFQSFERQIGKDGAAGRRGLRNDPADRHSLTVLHAFAQERVERQGSAEVQSNRLESIGWRLRSHLDATADCDAVALGKSCLRPFMLFSISTKGPLHDGLDHRLLALVVID